MFSDIEPSKSLCDIRRRHNFVYKLPRRYTQWRSDGGAGRTGRHLLGAAKGRKTPKIKKKSRENSDCKFHMCLRARKTSVTASVYLSSAITLGPWRQKGGLKGRQIWPPPWAAQGPATPLRGRPSKRWMGCLEEYIRRAGVTKFMGKHQEDKEWDCPTLQRTENSGGSW